MNKKLKIMQINICSNYSTGKIAQGIHKAAKAAGMESKVAYTRGAVINDPDFIKFGSKFGVYIHGVLARIFDTAGLHSSFATKRLIKEIEKFQPDIIHLHNLHGYYLNYKMLLKYIAAKNIKTVYTLHDCWSFTGHCAHFDMVGCKKWKTQCYRCPNKSAYPKSLLFDRSKKNYQLKKKLFESIKDLTVVTPSKWLAELVGESFLNKFDIKVIHNGIDLEVFKPTDSDFRKTHGLENKKIILGVAGVWTKKKGLDDFIKLRKQLNDDYAIVLVGLTPKQIDKLPDGIVGITRTESAEELAGIYTTADVFVNPTYEDNFPTVNLEALACGTPVITYNTGGSPECIYESCGWVVRKGCFTELAKTVLLHEYNNQHFKKMCVLQGQTYNQNSRFADFIELYQKKEVAIGDPHKKN